MQDKVLTATGAYQLFFECVSSCIDMKEEGIRSGVLQEGIDDLQAIPALIAMSLWNYGYEFQVSPSMMYSFLKSYAVEEMSEDFLFSYQQYSLRAHHVEVTDDITNETYMPLIDMVGFAEQSKKLGYKEHWGLLLKDPYKTQWSYVFNGKSEEEPKNLLREFISRFFK
ncbi:hypothetical protein ACSTDR_21155 [Vibrio vulnificus]|uniref:hypothetical protein n=1 Tax=Vibrio vulnificus TaxID=672 RepID=UPI003EDB5D6F